jgi:hypothetical protein
MCYFRLHAADLDSAAMRALVVLDPYTKPLFRPPELKVSGCNHGVVLSAPKGFCNALGTVEPMTQWADRYCIVDVDPPFLSNASAGVRTGWAFKYSARNRPLLSQRLQQA